MKNILVITLFLISSNIFSNVTYFGKNCKRTPRSDILTQTTGRIYVNGLLISENKKTIERPIRDAWVHLNNPRRHKRTMYHFEDNYKGGSSKFNGNYIQFYDEAGVEFDPMVKGHAAHGIIGIGLENQDSRLSAFLEIPKTNKSLEVAPETSCLFYFVAPNTEKNVFKVKSDVRPNWLYQKLYYNNNVDGGFLRKNYTSANFEPYMDPGFSDDFFHKYYPNYPDMSYYIED